MKKHPIIIVTAPSGSGKSTLINIIMKAFPQLSFSISACTRSPREGEVDGEHYHFISVEEFKKNIDAGAFIEWEMVYEGKYYGTLRSEFDRIWAQNKVPVVDIDVKGAINVQEQYRDIAHSIFIQAPSIDILKQRLQQRGTEDDKSLEERVNRASYEMSLAQSFDHIIVNDQLEDARKEILTLVSAILD